MKVFFDSSALAKRYINEKGSEEVEEICKSADELNVSIICLPEIISALNRLKRDKVINNRQYKRTKVSLINDLADAKLYNITPEVVTLSITLLEKNQLRAMDALHLACAIESHSDYFISSDKQQLKAAKNAGLKVIQV